MSRCCLILVLAACTLSCVSVPMGSDEVIESTEPTEIQLDVSFKEKVLIIPETEISGLEQIAFTDLSEVKDTLESYEADAYDIERYIDERTPKTEYPTQLGARLCGFQGFDNLLSLRNMDIFSLVKITEEFTMLNGKKSTLYHLRFEEQD